MSTVVTPSSLSLEGKAAIVTGSSRGIGRAVAIMLAQRGAKVAITYSADSSTVQAEAVAQEINALTKACTLQVDLEELDCGPKVIQGALKGLGVDAIDILVNNAFKAVTPHPPTEFDLDDLNRCMNLNIRAPMLLVKELLPVIAKKGGRIINISISAKHPVPGLSYYACSKAALEALSRQWAFELGKQYHCTVNAVAVGPTMTEWAQMTQDEHRLKARAKLREQAAAAERLGEMDDMAEIITWLVSDSSRWINGQCLNASGGAITH